MTAMLVEAPGDVGGRPGVTTAIARGDIEEALASDEPLDLILDVSRSRDGGVETTDVRVNWQRSDLETLLARMDSDAIILSFDRTALERGLDAPDFEGHGIREAVLLTVAAASASAAVAVSTASGQLMDAGGGGGATATIVAPGHGEATTARDLAARSAVVPGHDEASTAATLAAGTAVKDEATLAARGVGLTMPGADEATLAARGVEAVAPSARDEATLAARGIDAGTLAASHDEATLAMRGVGVAPAPAMDEATLASRGIEPQSLPATHDEATLAARGVEAPVTVDSGSSFELPSVDPGTAAAVGGLAGAGLLIAGAAFAARRSRVGTA